MYKATSGVIKPIGLMECYAAPWPLLKESKNL